MAETAQKTEQPLDELMMAMDVVDTLRHRDLLVERELATDQREDRLIGRLREIYHNQGIEVPDHILAQGVQALAEDRFVYKPPSVGFSRTLATIYVNRGTWGKWIAGALIAVGLVSGGWYFGIERPRQVEAARVEQALSVELPKEIAAAKAAILEESKDEAATKRAEALALSGSDAVEAGNVVAAEQAVGDLKSLLGELRQTYKVQVVSRPGTASGASRIPDVNRQTRNYYVIVEAIDPDGKVIPLPIKSEEDGTVKTVSTWGLRVSPSVFNAVRRDKEADGIVDDAIVGVKERGYLKPKWLVDVEDGRITKW
ncbi:MAG: hypothetical protein C0606_12065 [Hyphomicrobiales bacterium]|nr:MAG: hypothetical protein C0606_12065 [Hyphomicrobiales bacterium]